jgi:hypothetical protein
MADAVTDVPHGVRAQIIAAASSDDPSTVEEALRVARPFASQLEQDYAMATATWKRLGVQGTETARRLLQQAAHGDASTASTAEITAEIQRAIIRFAPVLENAELQSLTRRLTDSLGSRAAAAPVIGRYRVIHKAVARAGFELTSAAVDVLQPGRTIEVVERRAVTASEDPQGLGIARVRCTDGTWLSVSNRSGEPLIAELQGSPTLASPRLGISPPSDRGGPPTPSEDGDTLFEQHADAQLGDAIRQHAWMGGQTPVGAGRGAQTPRSQLRLVKSESEQLQPTLSLREFEEMEELAERETDLRNDDHQAVGERERPDPRQTWTPNRPVVPAHIPVPLPVISAVQSADGTETCETASRARGDVDSNRLVDASLALCEVVISKCRLPPDTANEVESLMREQQERWAGLAASLLRAEVSGGTTTAGDEHSDSGWDAPELRLLVQHVQAYQKASLRGFLELTYALDETLKDSQTVASAPKLETVHALFDESSSGRPLGLKFVHASDWARSGASAGSGMVVKAVVDGGAGAMACPALSPGAVLVGINDKQVGALSYGQTSALLKVAGQARPLQLTFKQLLSSRSSERPNLTGRASGIQIARTPAASPLTTSERDSLLEVLRQHSCLPLSELVAVLAAHEGDGFETLCKRVAKAFGQDPRHQRRRQYSDDVDAKLSVDEISTMKAELLSELEAQSALNAEWALRYEELELEVSTLTAELTELRAVNERYRTGETGTMSGRKHSDVADAVEAVAQAASGTLDRRALLLGGSRDSISVAEAMSEWHELLDRSRTGWRSEARVAASVSTLGSALEVTLSTIQQLGASLNEVEEEVVQLRGELASVIDKRSDPPTIDRDAQPMAQSLAEARAEMASLRAQLARESSSYPGGSSSPTRRAAAEATQAAAAARAQVGTLRASICQLGGEIDRLHLDARSPASSISTEHDDCDGNGISTPGRHGLAVEETDASNTSMRADLAEVALLLRKLGEVSTAFTATREELGASQRQTAALQADLRDVRDGQASAVEMHSKEEMASKDAQIADLSAVRSPLHPLPVARPFSLVDYS